MTTYPYHTHRKGELRVVTFWSNRQSQYVCSQRSGKPREGGMGVKVLVNYLPAARVFKPRGAPVLRPLSDPHTPF